MVSFLFLFDYKIIVFKILLIIALVSSVLIIEKQIKERNINKNSAQKIRLLNAFLILSGFIGSALFDTFLHNTNINLYNFNSIGLTFYGGLILAVLIIFIYYFFFNQIKPIFYFNLYALPLSFGHAIGRIGCFFGGCCFGKPTDFFISIKYPEGSIPYTAFPNQTLHPVQLYESFSLFVIFYILNKSKFEFRYIIYLILYGSIRFLLEFLRADNRGYLLNNKTFSPSQIISLIFIFIAVIALLTNKKLINSKLT